MVSTKLLGSIAIVLLILIVGLVYYFINFGVRPSFTTTLLNEKPTLSGQFIKNPDIVYPSYGWLSPIPENLAINTTVLNVSSDWEGNGWIGVHSSVAPLGGRNGIANIHPINHSIGRYIEQSTFLLAGNEYVFYLGIADAADLLYVAPGIGGFNGDCADVGIKVIIADITKSKNYTVFNKIIKNGGWYDYSIDLGSNFSGDNITIKIEGYDADAGCGLWNGEFAVVDYVTIVQK